MDFLSKTRFQKVSDTGAFNAGLIRSDTLVEFFEHLKTPVKAQYMRNMSNMYVLVGTADTTDKWSELLSPSESEFMKENDEIILGFLLLSNSSNYRKELKPILTLIPEEVPANICRYSMIDYIWTRNSLRGKGIARYIIEKYEGLTGTTLLPEEIASPFWVRYFKDYFGIHTLKDMIAFRTKIGHNVNWDLLESRLRLSDDGQPIESESDPEPENKYVELAN